MRYRSIGLVGGMLLAAWCLSGDVMADAGAAAEPLERLVAEAMERNPRIRAARSRWDAARARVPQAAALDDPMIGADVEGVPYSSRSIGNRYMDVEYMVSQAIPFPLKLFARHRAAVQEAAVAEQRYRETARATVAELTAAYYEVYRLDRLIEINRQNQGLLDQFAQVAESRYASGTSGQQDVLKAQTEQAMLANEGITLERERRSAVAKINALLNRPSADPFAAAQRVSPPRLSGDVAALLASAEAHNPALRAAWAEVEIARAGVTLAHLGYLPDFSTRLEARQFNEQSRIREYDVMLAVNLPVWSLWKQRNAVREAQANLAAAEAAHADAKNALSFEVQDRFVKADAAQRLVDLYRTSVVSKAEQSLASARAGYEGGRVEFLALLDAQRMLYQTQQEAEAALAALGQEMARLEEVVGVSLAEGTVAAGPVGGSAAAVDAGARPTEGRSEP